MAWNGLPIFEGEDAEGLKARFIELCSFHKVGLHGEWGKFSPFQIGEYVFANWPGLKDPSPRGGQCGVEWAKDLDVLERIRQLTIKGPPTPDATEGDLIRRALQIADTADQFKDRIAAIRLAGELQGMVKKAAEGGTNRFGGGANDNANDFLHKLAAALPN